MGMFDTLVSFHAMERDNPSQEFLGRIFGKKKKSDPPPKTLNGDEKIVFDFFEHVYEDMSGYELSRFSTSGRVPSGNDVLGVEFPGLDWWAYDGGDTYRTYDDSDTELDFDSDFGLNWDKPGSYSPKVQKVLKAMIGKIDLTDRKKEESYRKGSVSFKKSEDASELIEQLGFLVEHIHISLSVKDDGFGKGFGRMSSLESLTERQTFLLGLSWSHYQALRFMYALATILAFAPFMKPKGKKPPRWLEQDLLSTADETLKLLLLYKKNKYQTLPTKIGSRKIEDYANVKLLRERAWEKKPLPKI